MGVAKAVATGADVEIVGLLETRGLLAKFEPDLLKRLDATLTVVAKDLQVGAQQNLAVTGIASRAYRVRSRNRIHGFSKGVTTVKGSVAANQHWSDEPGVLARVFEFAENVRNAQPQNVARTRSMLDTLRAKYGEPGRFLWTEWDQIKGPSMATVHEEIRAIEAEYTERMGV